ncbi:MAG: CoA pyrophosphatase [Thaumarchaeota archaeon]|nr:CoA pyrophosphatase [Nitrososphaerota archaeon]
MSANMAASGSNDGDSPDLSKLEEKLRDSLRRKPGARLAGETFDSANHAAVCMILRPSDSKGSAELLLMKRAVTERDPWSGQMAFPGGRSRPNESIVETVRREVLEETKINVMDSELLGPLDEIVPGNLSIRVTPFVTLKPKSIDAVISRSEMVDHFWIPLSYFVNKENSSIYTFSRNEINFQVPAFVYQGKHVIWGMTRRIIEDFIARIQ